MTTTGGHFLHFDHLKFYVSNAKQASEFYCLNFGFRPWAYRGLETGSRDLVTHVVRQNDIFFVFESPLTPDNKEINGHLVKHGDSVKDVAYRVSGLESILQYAKSKNAKIVSDLQESRDQNGVVRFAVIQTFGDVVHTLIDRSDYRGDFWPGFEKPRFECPLLRSLPETGLQYIDHVVGNQPNDQLESVVRWYENVFGFHRYWSIDNTVVHTDYSALRSIVVANPESETIKMTIIEPAPSKIKAVGQIEEFLNYNAGPGVQHVAFYTDDIVRSVRGLKNRGVEFYTVSDVYYSKLRSKLKSVNFEIEEDLQDLQTLQILLDCDENGYLLQIVTKPVQDRPTLFLEVIQRRNQKGFGAGNFKALFEAVEHGQRARGNLLPEEGGYL